MSVRRFYMGMLLLPIVVPILVAPIGVFITRDTVLTDFLGLLFVAGVYGFVPYAIFAAGVAILIRRSTPAAIRRLQWFAPLICLVLFAGAVSIRTAVLGNPFDRGWFGSLAFFAGLELAVGYFYVGVIESLRLIALRHGVIAIASAH
jgi:hypothetical protein